MANRWPKQSNAAPVLPFPDCKTLLDMITAGTLIVSVTFAVIVARLSTGMGRFGMWGSTQKPSHHVKEIILEG
ncbi:hypothetical protein [Enterobacter hormaechei]|uniref:hypothetical protein n=1 Tax=Enterobacter hormaechei TaxID=158836 RepID=UPI003C30B029